MDELFNLAGVKYSGRHRKATSAAKLVCDFVYGEPRATAIIPGQIRNCSKARERRIKILAADQSGIQLLVQDKCCQEIFVTCTHADRPGLMAAIGDHMQRQRFAVQFRR